MDRTWRASEQFRSCKGETQHPEQALIHFTAGMVLHIVSVASAWEHYEASIGFRLWFCRRRQDESIPND